MINSFTCDLCKEEKTTDEIAWRDIKITNTLLNETFGESKCKKCELLKQVFPDGSKNPNCQCWNDE